MLLRDINDPRNSLSISTNVPESLLLCSSSPAHFACCGAATPCFTSRPYCYLLKVNRALPAWSHTTQTLPNKLRMKDTTGFSKILPSSSLLAQAVLPFTSEQQGLTWGLPHGIQHYLPESLQPVGVHHIYTPAEPTNQTRWRTGLGHSCSSLQLNFCGISMLCQSSSPAQPKARGQSLGCFCYQPHSRSVDTRGCCSLCLLPSSQGADTGSWHTYKSMHQSGYSNPAPFRIGASKAEVVKHKEQRSSVLYWAQSSLSKTSVFQIPGLGQTSLLGLSCKSLGLPTNVKHHKGKEIVIF